MAGVVSRDAVTYKARLIYIQQSARVHVKMAAAMEKFSTAASTIFYWIILICREDRVAKKPRLMTIPQMTRVQVMTVTSFVR